MTTFPLPLPLPLRLAALLALSLVAGLLLGGCAASTFENRLLRTVSGDRLFAGSLYGPFGLTAELSPDDAKELHRLIEQSRMAEEMVRAMQAQVGVLSSPIKTPKEPKK